MFDPHSRALTNVDDRLKERPLVDPLLNRNQAKWHSVNHHSYTTFAKRLLKARDAIADETFMLECGKMFFLIKQDMFRKAWRVEYIKCKCIRATAVRHIHRTETIIRIAHPSIVLELDCFEPVTKINRHHKTELWQALKFHTKCVVEVRNGTCYLLNGDLDIPQAKKITNQEFDNSLLPKLRSNEWIKGRHPKIDDEGGI